MAEIKLAMLAQQCWTGGWLTGRPWNGRSRRGRRRATGPAAGQLAVHDRGRRIKLKHLYPTTHD
jgi:hypothetical protein